MLSNAHTHTTFCDGKNTVEEMVLAAIDKGFDTLGFSGHGYTFFDLSYCIKDTCGYIAEVNRVKEKYKDKIKITLGIEEDIFSPVNRADYEYIISSSHYLNINGENYPIDSDAECLQKCVKLFGGDTRALAISYYETFCKYIKERKPDIVGHFDLITKYDEKIEPFFLNDNEYLKNSEKYMAEAMKNDVIFEVNTGAISRGARKTPYPYENLLYVLKKGNAKVMLNSDCHSKDSLDCAFYETKKLLRDIGFEYIYALCGNKFEKDYLN